jgi:hypothetical protein
MQPTVDVGRDSRETWEAKSAKLGDGFTRGHLKDGPWLFYFWEVPMMGTLVEDHGGFVLGKLSLESLPLTILVL